MYYLIDIRRKRNQVVQIYNVDYTKNNGRIYYTLNPKPSSPKHYIGGEDSEYTEIREVEKGQNIDLDELSYNKFLKYVKAKILNPIKKEIDEFFEQFTHKIAAVYYERKKENGDIRNLYICNDKNIIDIKENIKFSMAPIRELKGPNFCINDRSLYNQINETLEDAIDRYITNKIKSYNLDIQFDVKSISSWGSLYPIGYFYTCAENIKNFSIKKTIYGNLYSLDLKGTTKFSNPFNFYISYSSNLSAVAPYSNRYNATPLFSYKKPCFICTHNVFRKIPQNLATIKKEVPAINEIDAIVAMGQTNREVGDIIVTITRAEKRTGDDLISEPTARKLYKTSEIYFTYFLINTNNKNNDQYLPINMNDSENIELVQSFKEKADIVIELDVFKIYATKDFLLDNIEIDEDASEVKLKRILTNDREKNDHAEAYFLLDNSIDEFIEQLKSQIPKEEWDILNLKQKLKKM